MTEEQRTALSLLSWWWRCVEAEVACDGDPPMADDAVVLHFVAAGATAMVNAGHMRQIVKFIEEQGTQQ